MNPIIRNIAAVILGWFGGGMVNMMLVKAGHTLFPIEGIDPNNLEELARVMPGLEVKYFIFPFLAHALGTFFGAVIAGAIAVKHNMKCAMGIGVLFLIGGILACFMIPAPVWFILTDLLIAYIPMAWMGGKIAQRLRTK